MSTGVVDTQYLPGPGDGDEYLSGTRDCNPFGGIEIAEQRLDTTVGLDLYDPAESVILGDDQTAIREQFDALGFFQSCNFRLSVIRQIDPDYPAAFGFL